MEVLQHYSLAKCAMHTRRAFSKFLEMVAILGSDWPIKYGGRTSINFHGKPPILKIESHEESSFKIPCWSVFCPCPFKASLKRQWINNWRPQITYTTVENGCPAFFWLIKNSCRIRSQWKIWILGNQAPVFRSELLHQWVRKKAKMMNTMWSLKI